MPKNFVEELRWRGMVQDIIPGTEEMLSRERVTGYVGFDPTADSLHVGSLIPILLLMHLQRAGHKPIAVVGGATGMVGDPSGKSDERNLLDEATLNKNVDGIQKQLSKFLDFRVGENSAQLVNNYDWMKNFSFIQFIRDVGKHVTVNYMSAKDSVKSRIETGISFTEFSYQLLQGYDFVHLYKTHQCKLQMGGSDQWGNITTGTELIRRMAGGEAFAFTCPLMTKSDGGKFGKTESGAVWLDAARTSPYEFYQFWVRATDAEASKYIRTFTFLPKTEIEKLEAEHAQAPENRSLQKKLADEVTTMVHGISALETVLSAAKILYGKSTAEDILKLTESQFMEIFKGVTQARIPRAEIQKGLGIVEALAGKTEFLASNSEARRELKAGAIAVNKTKVDDAFVITEKDLIANKMVLLSKGKKNNYLLITE